MHERPPQTPVPVRLTIRRDSRVRYAPPLPPTPPRKKNRRGGGWWKGSLVVIGAMLLTTMASKASDSFKVSDLLQLAGVGGTAEVSRCPKGMVYVPTSDGGFCIDQYEVTTGATCPREMPTSEIQTNENLAVTTCMPESEKGKQPWVNVSFSEAMSLCARAGKRLPSPGEWYRAALGTPDTPTGGKQDCVLGRVGTNQAEDTGTHDHCVSSFGAYDMVGNVWEWVDIDIRDGTWKGIQLPKEGYISGVDSEGVPTETSTSSQVAFGGDYFYMDPNGVRGMFRGGYWRLGETAGVNTANATIEHNFVGNAVGFRCVR